MYLENKTAIVTGGGSGIGRAVALVYAREGARVVVSDIAETSGEETVRLIQQATPGDHVSSVPTARGRKITTRS